VLKTSPKNGISTLQSYRGRGPAELRGDRPSKENFCGAYFTGTALPVLGLGVGLGTWWEKWEKALQRHAVALPGDEHLPEKAGNLDPGGPSTQWRELRGSFRTQYKPGHSREASGTRSGVPTGVQISFNRR